MKQTFNVILTLLGYSRTTDSILKSFHKTIAALETHSKNQTKKALILDDQIRTLGYEKDALYTDALKASTSAARLKKLFN
jgi:hypothetical protein